SVMGASGLPLRNCEVDRLNPRAPVEWTRRESEASENPPTVGDDEGLMPEIATNRIAERSEGGAADAAVVLDHVSFSFDDHEVLRDISLTVPKASMTIILGASGAGKSVLLKLILGLFRPDSGTIAVNGHRIDTMTERDLLPLRADIGMLFQESALFDS